MKLAVVRIPIALPIQFTTAVIILDAPVTIIDPGVRAEKTLNLLENELKNHGGTLQDVKRLCFTHGHIDHYGIAQDLADISRAKIFLHPNDFKKVNGNEENYIFYKNTLLQNGVPEEDFKHVDDFLNYTKTFHRPVQNPLSLTESLEFENYALQVIETPGHTSGSVVYYHKEEQVLISGDTVIKEISPNPVFEFVEENKRFHSQLAFRRTIEKLNQLPYQRIIPGHGEEITDFKAVYEKYKSNWEKREKNILNFLDNKNPVTAFDIAASLFSDKMQGFNVFLALSEIIGFLDYLEDMGKIEYLMDKNLVKVRKIKNK